MAIVTPRVILVLLLPLGAFAQSAPVAKPPQVVSRTGSVAQQAKTYPPGTDSTPFVVKLRNTGRDAADEAADAKKIADDETAQVWTIGLTVLLAFANVGIVIVGVLQWRTLKAQRTVMARQDKRLRDNVTELKNATVGSSAESCVTRIFGDREEVLT